MRQLVRQMAESWCELCEHPCHDRQLIILVVQKYRAKTFAHNFVLSVPMSMVVAVFSFLLSRFHPRHRLLPPAIMFITGWRWCRQRRQPLISSAMVYELCNVTFYQSAATAQLLDSLIPVFRLCGPYACGHPGGGGRSMLRLWRVTASYSM